MTLLCSPVLESGVCGCTLWVERGVACSVWRRMLTIGKEEYKNAGEKKLAMLGRFTYGTFSIPHPPFVAGSHSM